MSAAQEGIFGLGLAAGKRAIGVDDVAVERRLAILRRIGDTDGLPGDLLEWGEQQGISWARMKDDWISLCRAGCLLSLNAERPGWVLTERGREVVVPHDSWRSVNC